MKKIYILSLIFFSTLSISAQNCAYLCNGDFESPGIGSSTSGLFTTVSCWNTTATDGKMEIWSSGFNGVTSYSNAQFCELNATQAGIVYQNFNVSSPGTNLTVSFAHRARASAGQTDSVEVSMGPSGGPYTVLGRFGDGPSAWGYYTTSAYTAISSGNYSLRFNPYYYGYGNAGVGNFIDAVKVCGSTQSGIYEFTNESISAVLPNPALTNFTIRFENPWNIDFTLDIYDYQGRNVKSVQGINDNTVKVERGDLKAGIYFYELSSLKGKAKGKIVFAD